MSLVSWEDLGRLSYFSCTTLIYKHILEKLQHQSENLCTKKKKTGGFVFLIFFLFVSPYLSVLQDPPPLLCLLSIQNLCFDSPHLQPLHTNQQAQASFLGFCTLATVNCSCHRFRNHPKMPHCIKSNSKTVSQIVHSFTKAYLKAYANNPRCLIP